MIHAGGKSWFTAAELADMALPACDTGPPLRHHERRPRIGLIPAASPGRNPSCHQAVTSRCYRNAAPPPRLPPGVGRDSGAGWEPDAMSLPIPGLRPIAAFWAAVLVAGSAGAIALQSMGAPQMRASRTHASPAPAPPARRSGYCSVARQRWRSRPWSVSSLTSAACSSPLVDTRLIADGGTVTSVAARSVVLDDEVPADDRGAAGG